LREHLESVAQQTGEIPQELAEARAVVCPDGAVGVWGWFLELHRTRGGGFGPEPLSHREIAAWASLTGQQLEQWELQALRELDGAWMEQAAKQVKKQAKRGKDGK
jgi:hypothetical protein